MVAEVVPASHRDQVWIVQDRTRSWYPSKTIPKDLLSARPPDNFPKECHHLETVFKHMEGSSPSNHTEPFLQMAGTGKVLEEESRGLSGGRRR